MLFWCSDVCLCLKIPTHTHLQSNETTWYDLKIFMTNQVITGYSFKFKVHQASKGVIKGHGHKSGLQTLFRVMQDFNDTYRVVVCHRFATSVLVFLHLLKFGFFAIGTILTDQQDLPAWYVLKEDCVRLVQCGQRLMYTRKVTSTAADFVAMVWLCIKPMCSLGTSSANFAVSSKRLVQSVLDPMYVTTKWYCKTSQATVWHCWLVQRNPEDGLQHFCSNVPIHGTFGCNKQKKTCKAGCWAAQRWHSHSTSLWTEVSKYTN